MHPVIKKVEKIIEENELSMSEASRQVKVSSSSLYYWINGTQEPRQKSIDKMKEFVDRVESGDELQPTLKKKSTVNPNNLDIKDIECEKMRPIYALIYKLEDKYGKLTNADEDDPMLELLRSEVQ